MYLFVYGTLKNGHRNNHYLEGQELVDESAATVPFYRLFDNGVFPMMVEDTYDGYAVSGELWEIDEDIVEELDDHEVLYERKLIDLEGHDDKEVYAYIYLYSVETCQECYGVWDDES